MKFTTEQLHIAVLIAVLPSYALPFSTKTNILKILVL